MAVKKPVSFRDTLKPGQVETPLDLWFYRPVAFGIVKLALYTPLSANGMTVISILIGLAGAICLRFPEPRFLIIGSLLSVLYAILDCADGQLARARGTSSRLGRILDGMSDYIVGVTSGVTIALHLRDTIGTSGVLLAIGGLASILLQGTLFDHYKNRFLSRSRSTYREGDDLEETLAALRALRAGNGSFALLALHAVYALFLQVQQKLARGSDDAPPSEEAAARFAARLAPVAKAWAYLGPSTHVTLLAIFVSTGHLREYVWLRLTLGNAVMVALIVEQRRRERSLD